MAKNIKAFIRQCVNEVLMEELDIPSNDGTSTGADPDDKEKAKDATKNGDSVKFVKPGELEDVEEEAVPNEKVGELIQNVKNLSGEIEQLYDYAKTSGNKKMEGIFNKLSKNFESSLGLVDQLKTLREQIMAEEKEKASEYGDKVIKCLGKYTKMDENGGKLKEKYMPYIEAAFKKGKKPQEVADRIKDHRFEM